MQTSIKETAPKRIVRRRNSNLKLSNNSGLKKSSQKVKSKHNETHELSPVKKKKNGVKTIGKFNGKLKPAGKKLQKKLKKIAKKINKNNNNIILAKARLQETEKKILQVKEKISGSKNGSTTNKKIKSLRVKLNEFRDELKSEKKNLVDFRLKIRKHRDKIRGLKSTKPAK